MYGNNVSVGLLWQRTERAPKDRNIAETDPARFAQLLTEKLDKEVEQREAFSKVEEKMRILNQVNTAQNLGTRSEAQNLEPGSPQNLEPDKAEDLEVGPGHTHTHTHTHTHAHAHTHHTK